MKLLVFSDSHGKSQKMLDLIEQEPDVDACFHLGDGFRDVAALSQAFPALPLFCVQGNCDVNSGLQTQGLAGFAKLVFFYTHGHLYGVKQGLTPLGRQAKACRAQVALFGHTHQPFYENWQGIHLFNPGSISAPRRGAASYGCISIAQGMPTFTVRHI